MKLKNKSYMTIAESSLLIVVHGRNILTINKNAAGVGTIERAENLQEGGFSGAAWANHRYHFACVHMNIYAFQHLK